MYCPECGFEIQEGMRFCGKCGYCTETVTPKRSTLPKAKLIKLSIAAVLIIGVIWLISYLCSTDYLEDQLCKDTWYQYPKLDSYYQRTGSTLRFYSNGKAEEQYYQEYTGYAVISFRSSGSVKKREWEILDDKTLLWNGHYYEWGEDWSLSGNTLTIGDQKYSLTNRWDY